MSEPISPTVPVSAWLENADAALDAVVEHASNVSEWGAVEWGAMAIGAIATVVKVAKFLPIAAPWADIVDQWLPRLTGRKEAELAKTAEKNLDTAKGAVLAAQQALDALKVLSPEMHDKVISGAKDLQNELGIREEVRAVLKGLTEDG